jgi:polyhydroxybutyrate depolymerase
MLVAGALSSACSTPTAPDVVESESQSRKNPDPDLNPALVDARPYGSSVPSGYDGTALPLVLALHGYGSNGPAFVSGLGLLDAAERDRFLLAYPTGQDVFAAPGWAAMSGLTDYLDDVAYLRAVIADMSARYAVDPGRVVVIGFSFGAFMANYFACRASDRISGVVALGGGLVGAEQDTCTFARSVAVTLVHGTSDEAVAYEGGPVPMPVQATFPSAPDLFKFWADRQGCASAETLAPRDIDGSIEGAESRGFVRRGCNEGRSVTLWSVEGGMHRIAYTPGTIRALLADVLGSRRP